MTSRSSDPWEVRAKALAEEAFNRSAARREQEVALAEREYDLRHAIKTIDERLKGIPTPTHDPKLLDERDELLRHRGELSKELELLGRDLHGRQDREQRFDLSR